MKYKGIIFDFFGVIGSEVSPYWLESYFSEDEADSIKSNLVRLADEGKMTQDELFTLLGEKVGISHTQVEDEWWSYVEIYDQMVKLIKDIEANYKVGLMSNSPGPFLRKILYENNLIDMFDSIVISSEVGCAKPNVEIFSIMLDKLGIESKNALFIDDNPVNINAASEIGLNTVLHTSTKRTKKEITIE